MDIKEIIKMAEGLEIESSGKPLVQLIREIQRKEGNFECFGTSTGCCDQTECMFRSLCLGQALKASPPPHELMYYSTTYLTAGMPFARVHKAFSVKRERAA